MTVWLALVLGFIWGGILAGFLQFTPLGHFLYRKRTWLTVVMGVGVDLLIAWPVVERQSWWIFVGIIALSGVLIFARSLANEMGEWGELLEFNGHQDTGS